MKASKQVLRQLDMAKKSLNQLRKKAGGAGKGALAGLVGTAVMIGNGARLFRQAATVLDTAARRPPKKSGEGFIVKKSTVVALFMALAAVAGALAALYFYVLRREKELDEYEELLFSEDFDGAEQGEEEAQKAEDVPEDA